MKSHSRNRLPITFFIYTHPQPCDPNYPVMHLDYSTECQRQQINHSLTHYQWELSHDAISWTLVELETAFTSVHGQVLETVYLEEGLYVRCSAHAVDNFHTQGYSRTSTAIQLVAKCDPLCTGEGSLIASMATYEGFSKMPEVSLHFEPYTCSDL